MTIHANKLGTGITVLCAAVLLTVGCASTPRDNARLSAAKNAFNQANNDPAVARDAPNELSTAQNALRRADQANIDGENEATVNHLSYLAAQRTAIARETALAKQNETRISQASSERERLALMNRASNAEADANRANAEAEAARLKNRQLQEQMRDLQAKETDRGLVLTLGDVLFATGRSSLRDTSRDNLSRLAQFMRDNPKRNVSIEGHTDSTGSKQTNERLSLERAEAVKSALVTQGVEPNRIATTGFADLRPVADNGSATGRQQNRRVEIVISDESGKVKEAK